MSTVNATAHGLVAGQEFRFANIIPDDTGIDEAAPYYVLATNLTANTFEFSDTPGGSSFTLTANITSGSIVGPPEYTLMGDEERADDNVTDWVPFRDIEGPAIPSGLTTTPAVNAAFVQWSASTARDLAFYELRYAPDVGNGTQPDTDEWTTLRVKTTSAYVGGLTADRDEDGAAEARYWLQVRAVDITGNVTPWGGAATAAAATNLITMTSAHTYAEGEVVRVTGLVGGTGLSEGTSYYVIADGLTSTALKVSTTLGGAAVDITVDYTALNVTGYPTYRDFLSESEQGYSVAVSVDPILVGENEVEYQSIGTEHVKVTGISADVIMGGTLHIHDDASGIDGIQIHDHVSGQVVGFWNEGGLYVYNDADTTDYVRVHDGGISVFSNGVEVAAMTPDGINATALTFGSLPGGHNVIMNSSFELADFASAPSTATWDATADFTGTVVSSTNVTHSNAVTVTGGTFTY